GAGRDARDAGGREELGDAAALVGAGGIDQPHQQEERHHRGHEVGVRDLPGAAVVTTTAAFLDPLDNDRTCVRAGCHDPSVLEAAHYWWTRVKNSFAKG